MGQNVSMCIHGDHCTGIFSDNRCVCVCTQTFCSGSFGLQDRVRSQVIMHVLKENNSCLLSIAVGKATNKQTSGLIQNTGTESVH